MVFALGHDKAGMLALVWNRTDSIRIHTSANIPASSGMQALMSGLARVL